MAMAAQGSSLLGAIQAIVGTAHASDAPDAVDLATADIFRWEARVPAAGVAWPGSTEEVSALVLLAARLGLPVVPRGAGLSYTGGMACDRAALVIGLGRLDRIEVFPEDRYAVVGAGTSWARLAEALKPHGLEAAQASPISGEYSTVGGLAAQNLPAGLGGVLGMTAVLADGVTVETGLAARVPGARFWRNEGPDLTGVLLADCGTLAIKTEIVLRLIRPQPAAYASFVFDTADALLAALIPLSRDGQISGAFAMDETKADDARKTGFGEAIGTAWAMLKQSRSLGDLLGNAIRLGRFAGGGRAAGGWSLHLTMASATQAGADAQRVTVERMCRDGGGRQVPSVFPQALRAKPYSVRGMLGPAGERWVPIHGIFAPSRARSAMAALQHYLAEQAEAMREHGIRASWLMSSSGPYVLIEPMFYWQDAVDPLHLAYLSERNRNRFGSFEDRPDARASVRRIRQDMLAIMAEFAAAHCQLGRFYPYSGDLQPGAGALAERIKTALDPDGRLNPGALGFGPRILDCSDSEGGGIAWNRN